LVSRFSGFEAQPVTNVFRSTRVERLLLACAILTSSLPSADCGQKLLILKTDGNQGRNSGNVVAIKAL